MDTRISLDVDGERHKLAVDVRATLIDTLRERLGVTSPKKRCDHGQCGSCTVLVDSGQICSTVGMLDKVTAGWPSHATRDLAATAALDDDEIRERMSGNLCRCGAYVTIVATIREVAR
ncbi:MAG: 2Fe-2S iron-sulfur cluster binding domain-containing protein [Streptosporangiales bacterium]|nr:2Fe-2S iron-sulfur cluster binding domain-containing protein [Streptosporangiales bacterium]